uniref:Uncharacterized protein n=1 Tax=Chromera velia TaxID=505693 RepID=D9IXH3_9ALVE|nr:hypothetical protein CHVEC_pgp075 [Chromera velia]ADJ66501.2 hypothetical protein [Chromera velia]
MIITTIIIAPKSVPLSSVGKNWESWKSDNGIRFRLERKVVEMLLITFSRYTRRRLNKHAPNILFSRRTPISLQQARQQSGMKNLAQQERVAVSLPQKPATRTGSSEILGLVALFMVVSVFIAILYVRFSAGPKVGFAKNSKVVGYVDLPEWWHRKRKFLGEIIGRFVAAMANWARDCWKMYRRYIKYGWYPPPSPRLDEILYQFGVELWEFCRQVYQDYLRSKTEGRPPV